MAKKPNYLLNPSQDDRMQALFSGLGAAGQGFQNPDPTMPTSFAQSLTRGLSGFNRGFGQQTQINKADQLADMQAQQQQAQIQAQQMKIEQEKERQRNLAQYQNISIDPETMNPQGLSENEAFARAFPDIVAKQKAQALYPSTVSSREASKIQEEKYLNRLIEQFPPTIKDGKKIDHPRVAGFKEQLSRGTQQNLGNRIVTVDKQGNILNTLPVGLAPTEEPSYLQTNAAMKEALPEIRADTQTANSALRAYKSKTKLLEDLKNTDNIDVYTGALSEFKLNFAKVRQQFMGDTPEAIALRKKITSTEFLSARMGADVFAMLKPLGIGARGLDTPAERKFLQEVLTGKIGLERDTLIKMTQLSVNTNKDVIDAFNKRIGESDLYKSYLYDALGYDKNRYNLGATDFAKKYNLNPK